MSDHNLRVTVKEVFNEQSWITPLSDLDASPTRIRKVDFKPLILAVPFSLVAVPTLLGGFYMIVEWKIDSVIGLWSVAFVTGLFAVGFWVDFLRKKVNALSFTGPTGVRLPLWFNNPNRQVFEDFVEKLEKEIQAAKTIKPDDTTLAGEIQKLKDLLDRGILDREQFESAKNRLTGNEGQKRVGF